MHQNTKCNYFPWPSKMYHSKFSCSNHAYAWVWQCMLTIIIDVGQGQQLPTKYLFILKQEASTHDQNVIIM